jgi:hypothetical protein
MIYVYNETPRPWIVREFIGDSNTIQFSKLKLCKDSYGEEKRIFLRVNGDKKILLDMEKTQERLETMVNMKQTEQVSDIPVNVIFDKKECRAYITTYASKKRNLSKKLFLLTLNTGLATIVDLQTKNVFILEGFYRDRIFGAAMSLNSDDSQIVITTYNKGTRLLNTHVFYVENNEIKHYCDSTPDTDYDIPEREFMLRKFRPARLTEAVAVLEQDVETFNKNKEYSADVTAYSKFTIMPDTDLGALIKEIQDKGYKALTFFEPDERDGGQYDSIFQLLRREFKVFYTVDENSRIAKVKIR